MRRSVWNFWDKAKCYNFNLPNLMSIQILNALSHALLGINENYAYISSSISFLEGKRWHHKFFLVSKLAKKYT